MSAGGLLIQNAGVAVAAAALSQENTSVVCFVAGTLITTKQGDVPIETLQVGDMVVTKDHGYQPVRWIGSTKVQATGRLAPIRFRKGALANDRDLLVSPQHRMLLSGWQADLLFGVNEVLVAAKHLVNDGSITRVEGGEVEYFHMMFDEHEIVYAEGCQSESFHPGHEGWGALAEETRAEIIALFPQLATEAFRAYGFGARRTLKQSEAKMAVEAGCFIDQA
ncbi:Hint domain-containing protein [Seohaeicola saemankumensis]|nr:Hint domain-containing protein [Seohaeicola saemankumensis]